ncbi:hypothetical protein ACQ4PT_060115 [Festuca glaucescens]
MSIGSLGVVSLELDGLRARARQLVRKSRDLKRCLQVMRAKVSSFLNSDDVDFDCSDSSVKRGNDYVSSPAFSPSSSVEALGLGSEPVQVQAPIACDLTPIKCRGNTLTEVAEIECNDAEMAITAEDARSAVRVKEVGEAGFMVISIGDRNKKRKAVEKSVGSIFVAIVFCPMVVEKVVRWVRTELRAVSYRQFENRGGFDPGPRSFCDTIAKTHMGEVKAEERFGDLLNKIYIQEDELDSQKEIKLFVMPMVLSLFIFNKASLYSHLQAAWSLVIYLITHTVNLVLHKRPMEFQSVDGNVTEYKMFFEEAEEEKEVTKKNKGRTEKVSGNGVGVSVLQMNVGLSEQPCEEQ